MIGDGGDVELVDGGALFLGLLTPVIGDVLEEFKLGVVLRNVDGRRIEDEC